MLVKMGRAGPPFEPRRRPQAGKSGDPRSQNADILFIANFCCLGDPVLELESMKMGHAGPSLEPRHRLQAGKFGDPHSQNAGRR